MKKNSEYVGVDEKYIPEDEKYVDESLLGDKEETKKTLKKIAKGIGIGYLVFIIFFIIIFISMLVLFFMIFKTAGGMFTNVNDRIENFDSSMQRQIDSSQLEMENSKLQIENQYFNSKFEMFSGTKPKMLVSKLLDDVATNNKNNGKNLITVKYNEINTNEPDKVIEIKQSLEQEKQYEVILDYDTNGLVNFITIEDL